MSLMRVIFLYFHINAYQQMNGKKGKKNSKIFFKNANERNVKVVT